MDSKLKKLLPALTTLLAICAGTANAADDMQVRNLENRVNALEQRRGANGMINPSARPVVKDGMDLWIQGEALLMQPTEDGLGVAIESSSAATPIGRVKNANYEWNWGFRLGAGYNLPRDGWDVFFNWTWFQASHQNNYNTDSGEILFSSTVTPGAGNSGAVGSHVNLHVNLADLEMGREFFVSKWLTLRPHLGVRAAWVNRSLKAQFQGGSSGSFVDKLYTSTSGAGVRGGLDTQWGLGCGWSIFGEAAFSLIYGRQHSNYKEVSPGPTIDANSRNRWTTLRAITDLGAGLRWDQLFANDNYRIRLQLGWENLMFFDFNQNITFVDDATNGLFAMNKGNLALNGVSFQIRFDF